MHSMHVKYEFFLFVFLLYLFFIFFTNKRRKHKKIKISKMNGSYIKTTAVHSLKKKSKMFPVGSTKFPSSVE